MPPAYALEKKDEEQSLRVPSGKHLISGFGEDPGRAHHDRDPAWIVASERKNTRAEKPCNRAHKPKVL